MDIRKTSDSGIFRTLNREVLSMLGKLLERAGLPDVYVTELDYITSEVCHTWDKEFHYFNIVQSSYRTPITKQSLKKVFWPLFNQVMEGLEISVEDLEKIYDDEWYYFIVSLVNDALREENDNLVKENLAYKLLTPVASALDIAHNPSFKMAQRTLTLATIAKKKAKGPVEPLLEIIVPFKKYHSLRSSTDLLLKKPKDNLLSDLSQSLKVSDPKAFDAKYFRVSRYNIELNEDRAWELKITSSLINELTHNIEGFKVLKDFIPSFYRVRGESSATGNYNTGLYLNATITAYNNFKYILNNPTEDPNTDLIVITKDNGKITYPLKED